MRYWYARPRGGGWFETILLGFIFGCILLVVVVAILLAFVLVFV
jgi:hypothetical protein